MVVSFDLLFSIRETQLQHGLRSDDFAKYHHYLTGRIKTLRKQLKLTVPHKRAASSKKSNKSNTAAAAAAAASSSSATAASPQPKQPNKGTYNPPRKVGPAQAQDPRAVMLLALLCERNWAESEELRQASANPASDNALLQRHRGSVLKTQAHGRARLARAKQATDDLVKVVDSVGDDNIKMQATAYARAMVGRYHFACKNDNEAKTSFLAARELYHKCVLTAPEGSASLVLATELRTECDDRIITCMRRLGEDASSYRPPMSASAAASASGNNRTAFGTLSWLGRELPIPNFQAQNALRRFEGIDAFRGAASMIEHVAAVERTNGIDGAAWWTYQQQSLFNKQQDSFDRAVGAINDALDSVAAQLGSSSSSAAEADTVNALRLTQHCLKFRSLMCVASRGYLAAWSVGSRFILSSELLMLQEQQQQQQQSSGMRLPSKKLQQLPPTVPSMAKEVPFMTSHIVSPIDAIKLLDNVLAVLEEASLLPGVEEETAVEALQDRVRADRLFFIARGWHAISITASRAAAIAAGKDMSEATMGDEIAHARCVSSLAASEQLLARVKVTEQQWTDRFGYPCPVLHAPGELLTARVAAARALVSALAAAPQLTAMRPAELETGRSDSNSLNAADSSDPGAAAAASSSSSVSKLVASENLDQFVACNAFTQFPPDFQVAPCKPAFVDIAGTYAEDYFLSLPEGDDDGSAASGGTTSQQSTAATDNTAATTSNTDTKASSPDQQKQTGGGGWFGGWFGGGK